MLSGVPLLAGTAAKLGPETLGWQVRLPVHPHIYLPKDFALRDDRYFSSLWMVKMQNYRDCF